MLRPRGVQQRWPRVSDPRLGAKHPGRIEQQQQLVEQRRRYGIGQLFEQLVEQQQRLDRGIERRPGQLVERRELERQQQ